MVKRSMAGCAGLFLLAGLAMGQGSVDKLGSASDAAQRLLDHGLWVEAGPDSVIALGAVQEQPEFPGGMERMYEHLVKETRYPSDAFDAGIQGTVYVQFVVGSDGAVRDATVTRSAGELLDNEALRVIGTMPHWKPGRHNGKPVPVRYVLPITFRLD